MIWFAIDKDFELWNLCDCGDSQAAEESAASMGVDVLWLLDEHTAHNWLNTLMKGISMNSRLRITDVEVPSGSSENQNADFQLYFTVNDRIDVCLKKTEEGYLFDAYKLPISKLKAFDSVMTTWVHDNDLQEE